MRAHTRYVYITSCAFMVMYVCWNMGRNIPEPQLRSLCEQYMKDTKENASVTPHSSKLTSAFPPTYIFAGGRDINPDIMTFFSIKDNERKDTFINLHKYQFTLNSQICSENKPFLIMVIHSAPRNFKRRRVIRTTYGSVNVYRDRKLAVVFMLGSVSRNSVQVSVLHESQTFGDIVQGNFPDSYKSLNRKHIMAMHWFKDHCKAEYILKLDDDVFVNPFRIVDYILREGLHGMTMHCKVITRDIPARDPSSKWYTPKSQYPFPVLASFCLGFAYITTPEAWMAMYKASENNRLMNMDDLYVSMVLAMKTNVVKIDFEKVIYACPKLNASLSVEELNENAFFLDPRNFCGDQPFTHWKKIWYLNSNLSVQSNYDVSYSTEE